MLIRIIFWILIPRTNTPNHIYKWHVALHIFRDLRFGNFLSATKLQRLRGIQRY
jgi:hypothetical protein